MYLEFMGLSGSGKSTLLYPARDAVRARGIKSRLLHAYCRRAKLLERYHWTQDLDNKIAAVHQYTLGLWRFSSEFPDLSKLLFEATKYYPRQSLGCARTLAAVSLLDEIGHEKLYISVDEGILHRGVALYAFAEDDRGFDKFLKAIKFPEAVVFLNISPEEAIRRGRARGKLIKLPKPFIHEKHFARQHQMFERIAAEARARKVPLIEVTADEPLSVATGRIADFVCAYINQGSPSETACSDTSFEHSTEDSGSA